MPEDRFYDGHTATAHRVKIALSGGVLLLTSAENHNLDRWTIADMRVIDANEVTGAINFGRRSDPAPRLVLHDSSARQQLLDNHPQLKNWRFNAAKRGWSIGFVWTLVGLVIATGCYFGWRDGSAYLAHFVPRSWEKNLGAHIYTALTENLAVCKSESGNVALRKLVDRLVPPELQKNSDKDQEGITVEVVDIKLVNAVALPGDHVMVTSGLIELATSPNMLSGVLAHEIAHLDLRHPTQSIISNLGITATVSIILGGSSAGDIASLVTVMSYSRKMEHEADIRGLELLKKAGLRADGMADFFTVMKDKYEESDSLMPSWLASHPGLGERAEYTKTDAHGVTAMTDAEWQALKDMCKVK